MEKDKPFFTVVTVCYNAQDLISGTMESVKSQTFRNYEYIVMDGKSADRTIEFALEQKPDFEKIGIAFQFISEKDSGIYNAMNKAIAMANGEWIVFMNCGDVFYSEHVLEEVNQFIAVSNPDIVVGDIVIKKNDMYMYKPIRFTDMYSIIDICHQSTYTKTELLKARPYDEKYRLAADRDFFCYECSIGAKIGVLHKPLSIYLEGGVSAGDGGLGEISEINKKYNISEEKRVVKRKKVRFVQFRSFIKGLMPRRIVAYRYQQQMMKQGWMKEKP